MITLRKAVEQAMRRSKRAVMTDQEAEDLLNCPSFQVVRFSGEVCGIEKEIMGVMK